MTDKIQWANSTGTMRTRRPRARTGADKYPSPYCTNAHRVLLCIYKHGFEPFNLLGKKLLIQIIAI